MTADKNVKPLNFKTYLSVIQGSIGSRAYRHLWAKVGGATQDVAKGGDLSCAFFVSFILSGMNYLNDGIHATVGGVVRDLEKSGWQKVAQPSIGSVLIWEEKAQKSGKHFHAGFYVGRKRAVSNHPVRGVPMEHHFTFGETKDGKPKRRIVAIYRNRAIEN